jgi:hypothetical protein
MLTARKADVDFNTRVLNTVKTLDECLRLHIALTKTLNPGFEFYVRLNPDFLLSLCKEYLQWLELDLGKRVESVPPYVLKGNKLLDTVTKQIPGLLAAHLLLAKGKLGAGDVGAALKHIERVLKKLLLTIFKSEKIHCSCLLKEKLNLRMEIKRLLL